MLYSRRTPDSFDSRFYMTRYYMNSFTVDGIEYYHRSSGHHRYSMISIRTESSDELGAWVYKNDGYPIDEERWLRSGELVSTNPSESIYLE